MYPLIFTRVPDTSLYLDGSRWSGVYVRDPAVDLPDTLDVPTALDDYPTSVFLLLSEALGASSSAQTLAADRIALALQYVRPDTRVAWIAAPLSDFPYPQGMVDMVQSDGAWSLVGQVQTLVARNTRLMLAASASVTADTGSLTFTPVDQLPHRLVFTDGRTPSSTTTLEPEGAATLILLDTELPGGGIELGTMDVSTPAAGVLDPNVRFFVPNTDPLYPSQTLALVHPLLELDDTEEHDYAHPHHDQEEPMDQLEPQ